MTLVFVVVLTDRSALCTDRTESNSEDLILDQIEKSAIEVFGANESFKSKIISGTR